jgi:hypothetical protein
VSYRQRRAENFQVIASEAAERVTGLRKEELYARAQETDIPGRSEMSKEQLVEALRARS